MSSAWQAFMEQVRGTGGVEAWASVTGAVSVWLTIRESIACWPVGLVSVVLYIFVFEQAHLYADMGLQVMYVVLQFYGWYQWLHGGQDYGAVQVQRTTAALRIRLMMIFVVSTVVMAVSLGRYTNASLPWLDSTQTVMSLMAQYLLSFKWVESWVLWIAVDILSIGMYFYKGLYLTTVLYAIFLGMAVAGYRAWTKTLCAAA